MSALIRRLLAPYRRAYRDLPADVWRLALVSFVNRSGTMVVPFLVLYLTDRVDLGPAEAGRVLSLYGVGSIAGVGIGGWLTDRVGAVRVQTASLVAGAVGLVVLGQLTSPLAISVAVLLFSTANEAFRPASVAAIAEHAPPRVHARAFGLNRMAVNLGWTIGPALGGMLAVRDYAWLFRVDAASCLFAAAMLLPLRNRVGHPPEPEAEAAPARSPWRDKPLVAAVVLTALSGIAFFQVHSTFPLFLHDVRGFAEDKVGFLFAVNTVMIVLFEMVLLQKIEHARPLRIVALGGLFIGLGFGLLPFGESVLWVAFTIAVWTVGEMLSAPMIMTFVSSRARAESRGKTMALLSSAFAVALVLAPIVGPSLYELVGPYAVWYLCAALGFSVAVGFFVLERVVRREGQRPIS